MSDSEQLFDLVVLGHDSPKPVEALVKDILNLLGDDSTYLEFKLSDALLFNNGMVSIRDSITFAEARDISDKLATLGVDCDIRPTLQLIPMAEEGEEQEPTLYICPACAHQQPKQEQRDGRLEICEVCGVIGERYLQKQKLEQVMEQERQQHDNDRAKRIREVLERAKREEETLLREEARRRLGISEKPDRIGPKVAAVVAILAISFGIVYYANQPTDEEIAQQTAAEEAARLAKELDKQQAMAKAVETAMKKSSDTADMMEKMPSAGAAGPSGAMDQAMAAISNPPEASPENALEQQTDMASKQEERRTKIIEALKADIQQPETPEQMVETKVQEDVSVTAVAAIEEQQLAAPRFQVLPDEHAENRRRIQQLLKLDETDLADMILAKVKEPYERTLLMLDMVEWQLQNNKAEEAQKTIARIRQTQTKTQDTTQQALILGCISKTYLLQDEWEAAGESLQKAMDQAMTLEQVPAQISLLSRLANEQSLFGNQIAARQILDETTPLIEKLPKGVEPRATALVEVASGYAVITDFPTANQLMDKVKNPQKRQKLAEFIDKLQHRVEQVRAEYQQAAVN